MMPQYPQAQRLFDRPISTSSAFAPPQAAPGLGSIFQNLLHPDQQRLQEQNNILQAPLPQEYQAEPGDPNLPTSQPSSDPVAGPDSYQQDPMLENMDPTELARMLQEELGSDLIGQTGPQDRVFAASKGLGAYRAMAMGARNPY